MAVSPGISSEFVLRSRALTQAPDDYNTKAEALSLLLQMKALAASGDAVAQYRLAQAYSRNSPPWLMWMQAAAKQGFTNAMLALSLGLAENGTVAGVQQAARHLVQIFSSNDSYIKNEAKRLVENNPLLGAEVTRQMATGGSGKSRAGFFAHPADLTKKEAPVEPCPAKRPPL